MALHDMNTLADALRWALSRIEPENMGDYWDRAQAILDAALDKAQLPPQPEPEVVSYVSDSVMRNHELRSFSASQMREYAAAYAAALTSVPAAAPQGEPTKEMLAAGVRELLTDPGRALAWEDRLRDVYKAMCAASQGRESWPEWAENTQDRDWRASGGFFQRLNGEDHACIPLAAFRALAPTPPAAAEGEPAMWLCSNKTLAWNVKAGPAPDGWLRLADFRSAHAEWHGEQAPPHAVRAFYTTPAAAPDQQAVDAERLTEERTPLDRFENEIRRVGIVAACEWFGHSADSEFTKTSIRVLNDRAAIDASRGGDRYE